MAQLNGWMKTNRLAAALIVGVVSVLVLGAAFLGIAKATDQPQFCGSACHEMAPYHAAWSVGAHKDIACIECHVDEGQTARLSHKFEAMKEVAAHFTGDTSFPRVTPAVVPDSRCLRCHDNIDPKIPGFNHATHAKGKPCMQCHSDAGHKVTPAALLQAGILNTAGVPTTASSDATKAAVDAGSADLVGHVTVSCSRCHVMSKTPCSSCHTPKHKPRGECSTCHQPGVKFVFTHPLGGVDCASCHKTPAKHTTKTDCTSCHPSVGKDWKYTHPAGSNCAQCHTRPAKHRPGTCADCHKKPGVSWTFAHPANGTNCASCHDRPAGHRAGSCASCHKQAGTSWAFAHPSSGASCANCHARPAGHNSGSCASCHRRPGVSWAFSHPSRSANCSACHPRPGGHKSGQCSSCHRRAGVSWAFSHPGIRANCSSCHPRPGGHKSGQCSSCHKRPGHSWAFSHPGIGSNCQGCHARPAGMSGGQCSNCHRSPGRSWAFSHPRIPGGQHTSKSFPCSSCHPNGYTTHTCIKCHDSASGGD
jgi:nitrate/TMAO reductase-like tetraheme cytochrome c subunit